MEGERERERGEGEINSGGKSEVFYPCAEDENKFSKCVFCATVDVPTPFPILFLTILGGHLLIPIFQLSCRNGIW